MVHPAPLFLSVAPRTHWLAPWPALYSHPLVCGPFNLVLPAPHLSSSVSSSSLTCSPSSPAVQGLVHLAPLGLTVAPTAPHTPWCVSPHIIGPPRSKLLLISGPPHSLAQLPSAFPLACCYASQAGPQLPCGWSCSTCPQLCPGWHLSSTHPPSWFIWMS